VQPVLVDDALQALVAAAARHAGAQPVGLAADRPVHRLVGLVVQHHAREADRRRADAPRGVAAKRARVPRERARHRLGGGAGREMSVIRGHSNPSV